MGLFFGILVLAALSAAAVFSIIINRRENKDRYATQKIPRLQIVGTLPKHSSAFMRF